MYMNVKKWHHRNNILWWNRYGSFKRLSFERQRIFVLKLNIHWESEFAYTLKLMSSAFFLNLLEIFFGITRFFSVLSNSLVTYKARGLLCFVSTDCPLGFFGRGCQLRCGSCGMSMPCDPGSGECPNGCRAGYAPPYCNQSKCTVKPHYSEHSYNGLTLTVKPVLLPLYLITFYKLLLLSLWIKIVRFWHFAIVVFYCCEDWVSNTNTTFTCSV